MEFEEETNKLRHEVENGRTKVLELEARLQKKSGDLDSRKKEVAHMMKQKSQITKERNELKTFVDAGKSVTFSFLKCM